MQGEAVVFFAGTGRYDRLIRWVQRRRYPARYARWTHVAIGVSGTDVVEAVGGGVRRRAWNRQETLSYLFWPVHGCPEQWAACREFALSCVGKRYGRLTALAVGLQLLTGGRLALFVDGTEICSGLVAEAVCRLGYVFPKEPVCMTPADLAAYFGIGG